MKLKCHVLGWVIVLAGCLNVFAGKPSEGAMRALGQQAAKGDLNAIDQLAEIKEELYKGIEPEKDRARLIENLRLMRIGFDEIGKKIGRDDTDGPALTSLKYALKTKGLSSFVIDALGDAAAMGNKVTLQMLLDYKANRLGLSTVVFALGKAAEKEIPEAVEFMISIMDNDQHRALWRTASMSLKNAARHGNLRAKAAMLKYTGKE